MSELLLEWSLARQRMVAFGEAFEHVGDPDTTVAHDLCHLIIAANGGLPWRPSGADKEIRLAEFNAVFLEHVYFHAHASIVARRSLDDVLELAQERAQDFVERYYAPFPITFPEARGRFLDAISPELVGRLLPTYLDAYGLNEEARRFPFGRVGIRFDPEAVPDWEAPGRAELEALLARARRRAMLSSA